MKTSLYLLLMACLAACQPTVNPQATTSPKPNPTISATISEPVPSGPAPSSPATNTPDPSPSPIASVSASPAPGFSQPFDLTFQQARPIAGQNIELNFIELIQDSRCPSDVTCVWAGEVTVKVQAKQDGQILGTADLTLGADSAKASAIFGFYKVTLLDVSPYPVSTQSRQSKDYQIKVQIDVQSGLAKNKPQKTL